MASDLRMRLRLLVPAALVLSGIALAAAAALAQPTPRPASPIFGVTIPDGYRAWQLIAPAVEGEPLNELRAVVGNAAAVKAYASNALPFPDGTVLVKLAWRHVPSPEFEPATVPGRATTVQVMVKDAKRYPETGGWGFGRFVDGEPVDEAQHRTCVACHEARVTHGPSREIAHDNRTGSIQRRLLRLDRR